MPSIGNFIWEFIQFKVGSPKTHLALLGTKIGPRSGFVTTLEVSDIRALINEMKKRGLKFTSGITEFEHVYLVEFSDHLAAGCRPFSSKPRRRFSSGRI